MLRRILRVALCSILVASAIGAAHPELALGALGEGRLSPVPRAGELVYLPSADHLSKPASIDPRAGRHLVKHCRAASRVSHLPVAVDRAFSLANDPPRAHDKRPLPRRGGSDLPPLPD